MTDKNNKVLEFDNFDLSLNDFLATKQRDTKENWIKIDKTMKIKKLNEFVDETYKKEYNLSSEMVIKCKTFLIDLLDKKKLLKIKEINYNKTEERIMSIPNLTYNKVTGIFSITNDRRVSTLKSLPNLKKHKDKKKSKTCDVSDLNKNKIEVKDN